MDAKLTRDHACASPPEEPVEPADQRGFSVVELMVSAALAGIVALALLFSFVTSTKSYATNTDRNITTGELAVAFDFMTQTLQSSYKDVGTNNVLVVPSVQLATSFNPAPNGQYSANSGVEATFYATTRAYGPAIVHWFLNTNDIWEEIIPCGAQCGLTRDYRAIPPVGKRIIISGVNRPVYGQRHLFTWYSATSTTPLNDPEPFTPLANVDGVVAVHLSLSKTQKSLPQPLTVENTIMLAGNLSSFGGRAQWSAAPTLTGALPTLTPTSTTATGTSSTTAAPTTVTYTTTATMPPTSTTSSSMPPPSASGTSTTTTAPPTTVSSSPTSSPSPTVTTTTSTYTGPPVGFL